MNWLETKVFSYILKIHWNRLVWSTKFHYPKVNYATQNWIQYGPKFWKIISSENRLLNLLWPNSTTFLIEQERSEELPWSQYPMGDCPMWYWHHGSLATITTTPYYVTPSWLHMAPFGPIWTMLAPFCLVPLVLGSFSRDNKNLTYNTGWSLMNDRRIVLI
jgi:hypothetical protein